MRQKFPELKHGALHAATDSSVAVRNVQPGKGDALAMFDLKIGGLMIRRVHLRPGPHGAFYVDMPSLREGDDWIEAVQIVSPALEAHVRAVVISTIGEMER